MRRDVRRHVWRGLLPDGRGPGAPRLRRARLSRLVRRARPRA